MGSPYVAHPCLEILGSSDPPALASQNVGITGVSHCARPHEGYFQHQKHKQKAQECKTYDTK